MIKNYIFDFDGTLADTAGGIIKTMQETFKSFGFPTPSAEAVKNVIGLQLPGCMRGLGVKEEMVDEVCAAYRKLFPEIAIDYVGIFPGVKETLTQLRNEGKLLAIATSRNEASLKMIMKRHGMEDYFEVIVSATDNLPSKPAPDMVLTIMERKGLKAEETMVIGDTTFDIGMGNNAGCHSVAVTYGNHTREQLMTAEPDFIIDSMKELPKCMK